MARRLNAGASRGGVRAALLGVGEHEPLERRAALAAGRFVALAAGLSLGLAHFHADGLYRASAEGLGLGLAVGLVDGNFTVSMRSGPSEVGQFSRRGAGIFVRHVMLGIVTGIGAGAVIWRYSASWFGGLIGLMVGVAFGVIDGLNIWLDVSTDVTRALSPRSTRRAERLAAFARSATVGLTVAVTSGIVYGFAYGGRTAAIAATVFGLGYALADRYMGLATSVWGRYLMAKVWLSMFGRLPWRFMIFLEDAHNLGLLRRASAVYQFRHIRLQEYLSGPSPARATLAGAP